MAVRVEVRPGRGRCLVAARLLNMGEEVLQDRPVGAVGVAGAWEVCQHCMAARPALPSPLLPRHAQFCSTSCMQAALASYHPYEAQLDMEKVSSTSINSQRAVKSTLLIDSSYRC